MKLIKRFFVKALRYSVLDTKDSVCEKCYPDCSLCKFHTDGRTGCLPLDIWKGLIDLGYKL